MAAAIQSRHDAIDFLYSRIDYERISASLSASDFKLDRMRYLLARIGDPQMKTPVVHIAGTKGKGSTAAMVACGLRAAGYRVGLFTSPHIKVFEERVQIDGLPIRGELLIKLVAQLQSVTSQIDSEPGGLNPTFFELSTALAWLAFAESQVDIAVLEVGLGGRLDSTNLCQPVATAITTISRDHTHILGSRIADIAREKAGILKHGVPVISGVLAPAAIRVIEETADATGCELAQLDRDFGMEIDETAAASVTICWADDRHAALEIKEEGNHQLRNSATACAVLQTLRASGWKISDSAIQTGIVQGRPDCRLQLLSRDPTILIDAAHNWASVGALTQTLAEYPEGHRVLVFSTSRDKDADGLLRRLLPHFQTVVLTEFHSSPRATPVEELASVAGRVGTQPLHLRKKSGDAIQAARVLCPRDGLICVAGSFFLAAEIRAELQNPPPGP
jgi:dihydrofolate synthase/folylpolyglutamate synthase